MRRLSAVHEEFEVGFNQDFEDHWYRAEQVGRVVMVLFTLASVLGLLGRGPFSHATARSADGVLSVDYEPIARHGTTTTVTVHIKNPDATPGPIELHISQQMIEPMGFARSIPVADSSRLGEGDMRLLFGTVANQPNVLVRFDLTPNAVGRIPLQVSSGTETVQWIQLVVP